ncbi:MAG: hypothetical protein EPN57_23130 [Paraburkholderia sp.]|nr:MAG: hypothetical protein EPN57_23130 [Paraburkholderia sp.]
MKIAVTLRMVCTRGLLAGVIGCAVLAPDATYAVDPGTLLPADEAFALSTSLDAAHVSSLALHFDIAPGYYLYRGRVTAVDVANGVAIKIESPPGEKKTTRISGSSRSTTARSKRK